MNNPTSLRRERALQSVAAAVTTHLDSETQALRDAILVLADMRGALANNDTDQLTHALERRRQANDASRLLTQQRENIKQQIANAVGVTPEEATVSLLAQHVEAPTRGEILERRGRLLQLHREADAINRGNAALAAQSLALLHYCLSGESQAPGCTRYSADGEIEAREPTSTIEARA